MKLFVEIWSYVKKVSIALTVTGGIVGASVWFYSQVVVRIDRQEETGKVILEKVESIDRKVGGLHDDMTSIRQGMVTDDELTDALMLQDKRIRAQVDYVVTHRDDPIDRILQDLEFFRKVWEQELKKNTMTP
jgi:hypothetical protein